MVMQDKTQRFILVRAAVFHREGTCLLEGLAPHIGALTLGLSRGVVMRRSVRLTAPCHALTHPVDKAGKGEI